MVIAVRFNLELKQYDMVNIFINTQLKDIIYIRIPPGYKSLKKILRLNVEITAQLPCSYSTLGCCSLVDLLPWECCRLHYSKVQSPQPQGVGVVVQGRAAKPPGPTGTH